MPSAGKPLGNERANATSSRPRANGTDLQLGGLTVEVPRAEALAGQVDTAHLRFVAVSAVRAFGSAPERCGSPSSDGANKNRGP